jgi:hypothetical protein
VASPKSEKRDLRSSPVLSVLEGELGRLTWKPSDDFIRRVERARRRKMGRGMGLGLVAVSLIGGAAFTFSATTYELSALLSVLGALLLFGAVWLMRAAQRAPPFPFAVFEDGVFVPATFESSPGISKFGPARAMRRSKIEAVEDMRRDGDRAIIVWTLAGYGGVVSGKVGEVTMSQEEQDAALDGFLGAVQAIGVQRKGKDKVA